jgi:HEAT repeat protein
MSLASAVATLWAVFLPDLAPAQPLNFEGAKWIWSAPKPGGDPLNYPACVAYFRVAFAVSEKAPVKRGELIITADNLFTVHLNGKLVGESEADNSAWNRPKRFDVAGLLAPGRNVLAVEAVNTLPGPAGLLVKLLADLTDGQQVVLVSDDSWRCSEEEIPNWQQIDLNDQSWRPAYTVAAYGAAPWGKPAPGATLLKAGAPESAAETPPPADYAWPEAVVFLADDCSLYRPMTGGTSYDSLTVTTFNPRHTRAFPEHDLPAPIKVGRKLYALKPARPGVKPQLLLDAGKGGIGSPSVSFDGRSVLVSMARAGDPFFHVWRVPAAGGEPQALTDGPFHDIDPAELPDGRIVFTSTRIGTFEEYHNPPSRALFVMSAEGREVRPLTHTFVFDNEPEVMADGRILFIRSDDFFDRGKVETLLHAIHPDGTEGYTEFGLDLGPEYGGRLRAFNCGSPAPMPDGRVAYVTGSSIAVGRPGCAQKDLQHLPVEAGDVAALPDGRLLCTVPRRSPFSLAVRREKRIAADFAFDRLGIVDPQDRSGKVVTLFNWPNEPLHSPVFLGARPRPPLLAEMVDERAADQSRTTGILFCENARFTKNTTAGWKHVRAIRVLAGQGLTVRSSHSYIVHAGSEVTELGTVPLAPDGSFAIEVPANTAIAFQAVDAEGRSELNEMSWIYVRPGETRGCVGCHQPRQVAPPSAATGMQAMRSRPLKLLGQGEPNRFRGNNAAVTGLMELQFDRYREVASLNRHGETGRPLETGAQEVAALAGQLRGADEGRKISAAQRLSVFRDAAAAPALAECLGDDSREVRVAAAIALGTCGTRNSVEPLLGALTDAEPFVGQAAALALENLTGHREDFNAFCDASDRPRQAAKWRDWFRHTSWDQVEAELAGRLATGDRDTVRRAAVALSRVGGDAGRRALRDYVARQSGTNPYPVWAKNHQGDGAQFNSLSVANPRSLQAATRALGFLKDKEAVPLLTGLIRSNSAPQTGNLFLAEAAAEALGRIGTPEAEAALTNAFARLGDYLNYTRWYGDHDALIACHASPVHYFITEALDTMGSTNGAAIVPHLIRSVPTDMDRALLLPNDDCETLIGRVIRRGGAETTVVETCLSILGDPQAARNAEVAKAIAATHQAWGGKPDPDNRAAQILSLVCRDSKFEPRIRSAFERYRARTNDIPRVFDTGIPVVTKLPAKNWVCFFLARAMGNLADPHSADALMAALEKSPTEAAPGRPDPFGPGVLFLHNDLTPCWRAGCAWALGRIGDRRAVPVLLKTVENLDNAPDTRHAAAEALGRLADRSSLEPMRKLAAGYPEVSTRKALLQACDKLAL